MNNLYRGLVVVVAVGILASLSLFTVEEREKAILFGLGEIVRSDYTPGLHFKIPFIQNVRKFDGRVVTMDAAPEEFLTSEKKNVIVDSFVKWRIKDIAAYYKAMGGDERRAGMRISQIVKDGLRNELGKRTVQDAVSGERSQIMDNLAVNARRQLAEFGIEVIDVRIKRIDLPKEVSNSVYQRMEAERARVAKDFRSRGAEEAERVRADADRQREIILAEAYRDAEHARGEGDAKAAQVFAKAHQKDAEFYALYRSLSAYKASFNSKNDVIVLQPDSDFFKYFNAPRPRK